jgi:hypothetical protein
MVLAGRYEEAANILRRAIAISETNGEAFYDAELRRLLAEALGHGGATTEVVLAQLDLAVRVAHAQGAIAFDTRAQRAISQVRVSDQKHA